MTELETDFLIVGGGFSGLIAAWSARRAGRSVLLVEKSPRLGGVLNSEPWGELAVDYGCHVFDNSDDEVTALLFEMAGADAFAPAPITYASRLGGLQSDGIALLDLSRQAPDLQARVLFETVRAAASDQGPAGSATASGPTDANLAEALRRRFGATAASVLDAAARKIFQCASAELSASALPLTLFQRLRIVPDEMAELLKAAPPLDDRIAVSSAANPLRFYPRVARYPHRNFYPAAGGMGGFVTRAEAALARAGVGVSTGVAVDRLEAEGAALRADLSDGRVVRAGRMMAASGLPTVEALLGVETPSIGAKTHSAALVLFYFLAPETAFTGLSYVHSFD
ncbi:MAG: NAD(P)-binding protein, partial [Pseudomonadota bacterium]